MVYGERFERANFKGMWREVATKFVIFEALCEVQRPRAILIKVIGLARIH